MRTLRATGGTHRDGALPASVVKVGVLGALATATIAAPLAAAAAGVEEGAELPQTAGASAPAAADVPREAVALPAAQLDDAAAETAEDTEAEARDSESAASRDQARTSPVADQEDSEEAEDTEPFDIEVEAPAPEPEPEEADKPDEDGAAAAATDGYVQPVDGPITSGYGYRTHPVLGSSRLHEGVDFGASCGTPVQAVKSGTVVATEFTSASGNRVKVDHGDGVVTGYYHLQDFATSVGATVEAGEVIGNVGNTGRSTGCHLHFAKMDGAGNYSDPMSILR
ncbi:MAG TPA: M23 family metallopeptidase [Candidatus Brachybacterium merdavium]|uniref:M23 family metallopeptidase n=1 Tax=Candidatus Brachybacterium merdavium TaxID=2838513 RepID=A0A9D2LAJ8_9MICO|nr:M23 family metallopeptidase [Candidatus Brachybacterium merdavium]